MHARKALCTKAFVLMKTPMDHYLRLKRQATRYMLNGDVERYMRILHEMLTIRTLSRMAVS